MFSKFFAFFKGFFGNVAADPVSTVAGAAMVAGGAYAIYTAPTPATIAMAGPLIAKGIHSMGTNTATGVEQPEAVKAEAVITQAAALVPVGMGIADQVAAIKATADKGQEATAILAAITQALPTPPAQ
jgi:hypothetical protein